jgi:hypothetical protein
VGIDARLYLPRQWSHAPRSRPSRRSAESGHRLEGSGFSYSAPLEARQTRSSRSVGHRIEQHVDPDGVRLW